jgi:hypothetical protein
MDGAKLAWDEYAMICGNLREELESEPEWLTSKVESIIANIGRRYGHRNRTPQDFEDFRADALAKLSRVAHLHNGQTKFEAFAAMVVQNMARDIARKRRVTEMEWPDYFDAPDLRDDDFREESDRLQEAINEAIVMVQDQLSTPGPPSILAMLTEAVEAGVITRHDCDVIESARAAVARVSLFRPFDQNELFDISERLATSCVRAALQDKPGRRGRHALAVLKMNGRHQDPGAS